MFSTGIPSLVHQNVVLFGNGLNISRKKEMLISSIFFPRCSTPFQSLNSTKQQNFGLVQIESICRQENECGSKTEIVFRRLENILVKGENAGNQHFLLFPQCFQRSFLLGVVKSQDSVVKGSSHNHTTQSFNHDKKERLKSLWVKVRLCW